MFRVLALTMQVAHLSLARLWFDLLRVAFMSFLVFIFTYALGQCIEYFTVEHVSWGKIGISSSCRRQLVTKYRIPLPNSIGVIIDHLLVGSGFVFVFLSFLFCLLSFTALLAILIRSTPVTVLWIAQHTPSLLVVPVSSTVLISASLILFAFKRAHRMWYGLIEVIFAVACVLVIFPKLQSSPVELSVWTSLLASIYLCVRGIESIGAGIPESQVLQYFAKKRLFPYEIIRQVSLLYGTMNPTLLTLWNRFRAEWAQL